MKIKQKVMDYEKAINLPRPKHVKPMKPSIILGTIMRLISMPDLLSVNFSYTKKNMEKAGDGPWLILMNHSSFLDLEIVSKIMYPKRYNIVTTSDGLVGKEMLMRHLGCIPTQKFVPDSQLIYDIKYALEKNKTSVLMYPEASYSFDGTETPLPRKMGVLLKKLKVPVVMITTFGSFSRDPLYNNLQKRNVKVTATIECLADTDDLKKLSVSELDSLLDKAFSFDYFKWQQENNINISEDFRADGLNRILYKCPSCNTEGETIGKGTELTCCSCKKRYVLTPYGKLSSFDGITEFDHIPDWYKWEREVVNSQIHDGSYSLDTECDIGIIVDYKYLYLIGSGTLHHDKNGFILDGCDGKLHYEQGPEKCYSLYSDYFWYEIGDMVCIGDKDCLYYCFPKKKDIAAKTRIAAEEIYKMRKAESKKFQNA